MDKTAHVKNYKILQPASDFGWSAPSLPPAAATKNEWGIATANQNGVDHILLILDKSGSMKSKQEETIDGVNQWLDAQRALPRVGLLTVVLFDSRVQAPVVNTPITNVSGLNKELYQPNGYTALYDAMAWGIQTVSQYVRPQDRVLVLVVTDGQENNSRVHNKTSIRQLIETKQALGNWTITYLSSDLNAFDDAASIGVPRYNTMVVGELGPETYRTISTHTMSYRTNTEEATSNFYNNNKTVKQ